MLAPSSANRAAQAPPPRCVPGQRSALRDSVIVWAERPGDAHSARNPGQNLCQGCLLGCAMNHIERLRPGGLVISPAFSHVAVIPPGATTIHVGGQNAVDGTGALVGGEDVALQTRQVMANLDTALAAAGATMADLVSVLVLLVDGTDLGNAYGEVAAALGDNPSRRWSRPRSCPGWGSRELWSRSRRSPHCSGERRARAGREDQGRRLADRRLRHRRSTGQGGLGLPHLD